MKILIVGGGIAGLSAAIALQLDHEGDPQGIPPHDITIAETMDRWHPAGAGLHLPGNAIPALTALGIERDVAAASCAFERLDYADHLGRKLFSLETARMGWPVFQALTRHDFHNILVNRLGNRANIRFGLSVDAMAQTGGNDVDGVDVTFTDGTHDRFDLVIGADGIHSTVRKLAFGTHHVPSPTGYVCWRWISDYPFAITAPKFVLGHGQVMLVMPVGGGRFYIYASTYDPAGKFSGMTPDALAAHFSRFDGPLRDMLQNHAPTTEALHEGRLLQMVMPEWMRGRVILIGDAAHGTLPTMAQGATQSIHDGLALANALGNQPDIATALADWQATRQPEAHWVQEQSLQRMGFAKIRGTVGVWLRNTLMKRIGPKVVASGFGPLIDGRAGKPRR